MKKAGKLLLLSVVVCLTVVSAAKILAGSEAGKFTIRKQKEEVVLYTLHRGHYASVGPAIGKLYALAGQKGIAPRGQACYVYLNNPDLVSSKHWLTEIRIPVGKDALKLAGTLGEFTDVKQLPAMNMAIAVKPQGQADPGPIYESLYAWIATQGYSITDNACEVFLTSTMSGDYARMKSEIMVPVRKVSQKQD